MPIQIMLSPMHDRDRRMVDLCRKISRTVTREWEFIALNSRCWLLVAYHRAVGDVVDHPLRQQGGHEGGKAILPWHQREHEVLGIGHSPPDAARMVLQRGKSLRLRAKQIFDQYRNKHLVFTDLDTGQILWPDQIAKRIC